MGSGWYSLFPPGILWPSGETTDSAPWHPLVKPQSVPKALHVPCTVDSLSFQETFLAENCKVEADAGSCSFPRCCSKCVFAESEDVSVALPGCAMPTPASIIKSSPESPRRQDCIIARTMHRQEASLRQGSVACCWFIFGACTGRHRGHLLAALFSEGRCASD